MALWLVRAGKHGQHEHRFFTDNRIYLTWDRFADDLRGVTDPRGVRDLVNRLYPDLAAGKLANWTNQISAFLLNMKAGDVIVVPRKTKAAMAIGEVRGGYEYDRAADLVYRHARAVPWITLDAPRTAFDRELLSSFSAMQTICQIRKPDAEKRVMAIAKGGVASQAAVVPEVAGSSTHDPQLVDLERLGRDQIARLVIQKFKGHDMARLVEAILKAQGYTTFVSPPGPDKGIDILAAPGPLGFSRPRICVQVKSHESPVDAPTLQQLVGAMQRVGADQGLLVAWGGFKSSVDKEVPTHFFQVRLWDQDALIDQLFEQYERLPEELRAELPLKRIWTIAADEQEE